MAAKYAVAIPFETHSSKMFLLTDGRLLRCAKVRAPAWVRSVSPPVQENSYNYEYNQQYKNRLIGAPITVAIPPVKIKVSSRDDVTRAAMEAELMTRVKIPKVIL